VRLTLVRRLGRDPGLRPTRRPTTTGQRQLDRGLLPRPRSSLATFNVKDCTDFAEYDGLKFIRWRSQSWNHSWTEPQRTGGHQRHETRTERPGRAPKGVGDHEVYRPPRRSRQSLST
jgi:hypothetical protein